MRSLVWVLLAALAACRSPGATRPPVSPPARATESEEDETLEAPSGETLAAHLKERLPGVESISLVKWQRIPERTPGPCTADFAAGAGATRIDLVEEVGVESRRLRGVDLDALMTEGWIPAYRTPAGVGLEKSAAFRRIDFRVEQTLECRCFGGERPVARYPVEVRFRWRKGALPAASASVTRGGRVETLPVGFTAGRLLVYEFRLAESFPAGNEGVCGGRLFVAAVVEPPIR